MSFDERRGQLVDAFWSALQERPFAELSLEMLAGDAGSEGQDHLAAGSTFGLTAFCQSSMHLRSRSRGERSAPWS